jgi:predicted N-acyltransferase
MPDGPDRFSIQTFDTIAEIGAADWDRCAATGNPFLSYAFLNALEESGSVGEKSGWIPHHAVLQDAGDRVVGVAPVYLKTHSYGEYVFDHGWADAYERAGGKYYPKMQVSVPFTPVTGPRLLVEPGPDQARLQKTLAGALVQIADKIGISTVHVTFPTAPEKDALEEMGFLIRRNFQYHWRNDGYESFDDFLGALSSRKRKSIRKERREVADAGLTVRALSGGEIEPRQWDAFYQFYVDTYDRKWGFPYLTRALFEMLSERLSDKVVLVIAEADGRPVAGALNFLGDDALFGRNWGCAGDFKFLHFEVCYYQAIDYAIAHGLDRVEAGTQGPHKVQRGYLPAETYSAHWLANPGFRDAVERFLEQERRAIEREMHYMTGHSPFKKTDGGGGDL